MSPMFKPTGGMAAVCFAAMVAMTPSAAFADQASDGMRGISQAHPQAGQWEISDQRRRYRHRRSHQRRYYRPYVRPFFHGYYQPYRVYYPRRYYRPYYRPYYYRPYYRPVPAPFFPIFPFWF